jgi:hypothetical protein
MVAINVLMLLFASAAAVEEGCSTAGSCPHEQAEVEGMKVSMLQVRSAEELQRRAELQAKTGTHEEFDDESSSNASALEQGLSRKAGGQVPGAWQPLDPSLNYPSRAPTLYFYAYRVQNDENYAPYNQNLASLGGALWYLQNEITIRLDNCQRRFGKTKLQRMKVTYKTTQALINAGMNFSVRVAFDSAKNTGDGCSNGGYNQRYKGDKMYNKYGYTVGCNKLGDAGGCNYPVCPCGRNDPGCQKEGYCTPGMSGPEAITYPDAVWYSFPGECPTYDFKSKSAACKAAAPGGACPNPDGRGTCTYKIDYSGDISLDELSGVSPNYSNFKAFCQKGCREYERTDGKDGGSCGVHFYDGRHDLGKAKERMKRVDDLFKQKYPQQPRDSEVNTPKCDFDKNKYFRGNWGS